MRLNQTLIISLTARMFLTNLLNLSDQVQNLVNTIQVKKSQQIKRSVKIVYLTFKIVEMLILLFSMWKVEKTFSSDVCDIKPTSLVEGDSTNWKVRTNFTRRKVDDRVLCIIETSAWSRFDSLWINSENNEHTRFFKETFFSQFIELATSTLKILSIYKFIFLVADECTCNISLISENRF